MSKITETEWLTELERLSRRNDAGMTLGEWSIKIGKSEAGARKLLFQAKQRGWLILGRRTIEALDGRRMQSPVYRVVKPKPRALSR